ncbi:MAG: SURF1 family protein [Alphaproteobacteria bacterium]|nr:SURF1 family protein [Alphaproteobacteria bacterium]
MATSNTLPARSVGRLARAGFAIVMVALTALFALFGLWQLERLEWKNRLIAAAEDRAGGPVQALPPVKSWPEIDVGEYNFTPVTATGAYADDEPIRIFIGLSDPKGSFRGPGHWYLARFELEGGGSVFVNRGFVPQDISEFVAPPGGTITLDAIMRRPERTGPFTPDADVNDRLEWVIDPVRIAGSWDTGPGPLAPFYLDLPAGEPGTLPQSGETDFTFSNKHLEYALTWFGLALVTPILLGAWLWSTRRSRPSLAPDGRGE